MIGEDFLLSLRAYLSSLGSALFEPIEDLSIVQEITALQHALGRMDRYPVIRVANPRLVDGTRSTFPVVTNLCASRTLVGRALGIVDHREAAQAFATRSATPLDPVVIEREEAPVQQVVMQGGDVDLRRLPALRQHSFDVGHYITAGHCTTIDPELSVDNTSVQRCWVKGERLLSFFPYAGSHNARNVERFWARGEACPIAVWVGHCPAVVVGSQAKLTYPESHWAATGGLAGAPIRLVPTITHGASLKVPADAEIVIEGFVPPHRLEADGPFAEYPGYVGVQIAAPVIEVTSVTHRADAIYHDFGGGLEDHLIPENMAMEGKLYAMVKLIAPSLISVHVPFSGRRFHAYLQFRDPPRGEVRDALTAALSYRRVRTVVAVDEDIDLFDDRSILWAVATRVQWHRDALRIDGLSHGNLDPSLPLGAATVSKCGIDATLPPAPASGMPKPVAPANAVNLAALTKALGILARVDDKHWPSA